MEGNQWLLTVSNDILLTIITAMLTAITFLIFYTSTRPEVVVYLRLDRYLAFICVENIGKVTVRDIDFKFPCSFKIHGDRKLKDVNFFDKGLTMLVPGQKKETFAASYAGGSSEVIEQEPIEIKVSYKGHIWKRKSVCCNIDFDEFQGIEIVGNQSPLDMIAVSIEAIRQELKKLPSN